VSGVTVNYDNGQLCESGPQVCVCLCVWVCDISQSCHTYKGGVPHMSRACHTYEWVVSHTDTYVAHVCGMTACHTHVARVTLVSESCHTLTHMSHICVTWRHVTHMSRACHTYEWIMSHTDTYVAHVCDMTLHVCDMTACHPCLAYVTLMNESCHTHEWLVTHTMCVVYVDQGCACDTHGWCDMTHSESFFLKSLICDMIWNHSYVSWHKIIHMSQEKCMNEFMSCHRWVISQKIHYMNEFILKSPICDMTWNHSYVTWHEIIHMTWLITMQKKRCFFWNHPYVVWHECIDMCHDMNSWIWHYSFIMCATWLINTMCDMTHGQDT